MTLASFLNSFATGLFVAFGGAIGALLRFGARHLASAAGLPDWVDTLGVNVVGCFMIGWLFVRIEARFRADGYSRLGPTPHFPKLQQKGWLLGPDPTLPPVELFRADLQLRFLSGLLLTGILGGFTTFSTFSFEVVDALRSGAHTAAIMNIGLSMTLPLAATASGLGLSERMLRIRRGSHMGSR